MEETLKKEQTAPSTKFQSDAHALKFWLMPFVCFASFGFPTRFRSLVSTLSGFAPLCFFILCGYFNLTPEPERTEEQLKKGIRRSGLFFAGLALVPLSTAHPALAGLIQALGGVAIYPLCFLAALAIDMAGAMGQEPPEGPF